MSMAFGGGGGHYDALLQQLDRQRQMRAQRPMMQPQQPAGGEVMQMRPAQFGAPQAGGGGGGMGGAMGGMDPRTIAGLMKQFGGMFGGGSDLGSRMPSMWERVSGTGMGGPIQTYGVGQTPIGGGY